MDTPITGSIEVTREGWLHIRLDTLLPNRKYSSVSHINEAVYNLLEQYEGDLPYFEKALLVIDEHSNGQTRRVYDNDNKAWKAIPNAMKGLLFADDDDRTLSFLLMTTESARSECHIYLIPLEDGARFINRRFKTPKMPPTGFLSRWISRLGLGGIFGFISQWFQRLPRR